jgi:hypothetical protein
LQRRAHDDGKALRCLLAPIAGGGDAEIEQRVVGGETSGLRPRAEVELVAVEPS